MRSLVTYRGGEGEAGDHGEDHVRPREAPEGKIRVTSSSWDDEKVILKDQVLEVRNVDGRLHVARKSRDHDD
jgi:hypothetical protein